MTLRLYYTDPRLASFDASVLEAEADPRGATVRLDRTAFYPTSGGQPFDTGTLGPARVLEVLDRADGAIVHVVDRMLPTGPVHGAVDWSRRFDHMQQHTGQHVLSAAFAAGCGARTESFHMGADASTIDLSATLDAATIARAEEDANRYVWEDRPVHVRFATPEEAAAMPLRKESDRTGPIRLIDVEGVDLSACGGTHVAHTGEIGLVAVQGWERYKGGTRVTFACGGRALRAFRDLRDGAGAAARLLSIHPRELPETIDRLQQDVKALRRRAARQQERLAAADADDLRAQAPETAGRRVVVGAVADRDAAGLKQLAAAIVTAPGSAAALLSDADPRLLVVARAADVPVDAAAVVREAVVRFGGRGGGTRDLAQGGGLTADLAELTAFLRDALAR